MLLAVTPSINVNLAPGLLMPAFSKVNDSLLLAGARYENTPQGQAISDPNGEWTIHGDKIGVKAVANGSLSAMLDDLQGIGFETDLTRGAVATGLLPLASIDQLAGIDSIRYIDPTMRGYTFAGATTTQGDASVNGPAARATGVDGTGIKVGVISDSFDTGPGSAAADIAS